jgi:hypothetical protein
MKDKIARYFLDVCAVLTLVFKIIVGISKYPRTFGYIVWHKKQATITDEQFESAYEAACIRMLTRGFTIAKYELREFSCGILALQMASLIAQDIAENNDFDLSAPISIVDYTRESDGKGHVRLAVTHGGKVQYYEPYAEAKYRGPKPMSALELKRANYLKV